jgi:hypothetical protein
MDDNAIKKPNTKINYTPKMRQEVLKCAIDPFYFISNFMQIQHPTKGAVPFIMYPYQIEMVNGYHNHRWVCCLASRQTGKALDLRTPLPTPTGWTTMGEVKVGDYLLGDDGKSCRVNFATDIMNDHKCYEIEFDNGEKIIADAEHIWKFNSNVFKGELTLTTEQALPIFKKANKQGQGFYIKNSSVEGISTTLPIAPYTLGVWSGDGYSGSGRFCGHIDDVKELSIYIEEDGYTLGEIFYDKRNNVARRNVIGLNKLIRLNELKNNKHIPEVYLRASFEQRLELLRGLMDTDGSVSVKGSCEFYQKNKEFILQVGELLSSLGIKWRISGKVIKDSIYYTLRFSTSIPVFKLERKRKKQGKCLNHPKNSRFYVKSITEVESVPVKCIQVDNESHMFLCSKTMIPTHNTTTAAAYLLWRALFIPSTTILICGLTFAGALEIMDRIRFGYENLPDHIRDEVPEYNKGTIKFKNGSKIVSRATTPNSGRGLSITLLYVDEFAALSPQLANQFWSAISPTLSTGGSCIITSTPQDSEDLFSQIYRGSVDVTDEFGNPRPDGVGKNGFFGMTFPWQVHPDRDEQWAKEWRDKLGEAKFRQEMSCEFISDSETLINALTLSHMKGITPEFYTDTVRWYKDPSANKSYVIGLDPSLGTGGDYAAIQVFELPEMIQIAEWQHNNTDPRGQVRQLMRILLFIDQTLRDSHRQAGDPEIFWTVENNTIGEAILLIIEDTGEERFPGIFISEKKRKGQTRRFRKGMNTDNKKKLSACARAKSLIESGRMLVNSDQLVKELKTFVAAGSTYKAKPGTHDDLVSAMLLNVRMLDVVLNWSANAPIELREYINEDELYGNGSDEPMPITF